MMRIALTVGLFFSVGLCFGQDFKNEGKVKKVSLDMKTPALTPEMQEYAVMHGSYLADLPTDEGKKVEFDGTVTLEQANLVDPKAMGIAIIDRNQVFKISGDERVLVVKSTWVLDNEMKNSKK